MAIKKVAAKKSAVKKAVVKKAASKKAISVSADKSKKIATKVAVKSTTEKKVVKKAMAKKTLPVNKTLSNQSKSAVSEKKTISEKAKKSRVTKRTLDQTDLLLESVVSGLEEKKAKNIVILDLRALDNRVSDYFVIAEGDSNTHVDAISGSVEEIVKKSLQERPYHIEGVENSEWIIIDYVNIVVHVFQREARAYYRLEELWADAKIKQL